MWIFCIWHCPVFTEISRTVRKSTKISVLTAILSGVYSKYRLSRLLLKSFHNLHFTFLFVNVYALFIVNVGLALVNLNKQTLHLRISGDHSSVLFYATSSFSFLGFTLQTRKKTFPTLLSKSYQKKPCPDMHVQRTTPILFCFSDVFPHFKNIFIIPAILFFRRRIFTFLKCFKYTILLFWCLLAFLKCLIICHVWEGRDCIPWFKTAISVKSL